MGSDTMTFVGGDARDGVRHFPGRSGLPVTPLGPAPATRDRERDPFDFRNLHAIPLSHLGTNERFGLLPHYIPKAKLDETSTFTGLDIGARRKTSMIHGWA